MSHSLWLHGLPHASPWRGLSSLLKVSEVAQSCPTLCDPMDCNLPGSSVHGIFQARVLEWVAISFSRGSSRPRDWTWVSCIESESEVAQSRPTLCDPMDCNLPGSSVHGFFNARVLEWVVISSPALQAYYSITYGLLLNHKIWLKSCHLPQHGWT